MSAPRAMPRDAAYWQDVVAGLDRPAQMFIDGRGSDAVDGERLELIAPRDGSLLASLPAAGAADVDRAVAGARRAFEDGPWRTMSHRDRGAVLRRWADLLEEHRDELAALIALEMGKPITDAWSIELRTTIKLIRWYGEVTDKLIDEAPSGGADSLALVTREPVGVVAAITPWNFPMTLAAFKVPAALATGNSVVLKPAEQSPLSMVRAAELAFAAGLPAGVLQVVIGHGPVAGGALARHNDVDTLAFTGSTAVGRQLLRDAGDSNLKPVWLELGGKSANIIFPDAPDLDQAIWWAAWAIAFNAGQMCTAGARLLVHESIHDRVVEGVVARLRELRIGDPLDPFTDMGPLSSSGHRDRVLHEIGLGIESGASLVTGSATAPEGPGWFVEPAVFTGVQPGDRLAQHEIFGPVLSVLSFRDEADAVAIANGTGYGLAAALWTADLNRAHRVARAMRTGLVWVNCYEEGDQTVPFGGRKLSGHGSDKSLHGLREFTTVKTTWIALDASP